MFSVGDNVTVVSDIREIEESAGRNIATECMSIGDKTWFQGLCGVVVEVEEARRYGRPSQQYLMRDIYKVDFGDESLPYCGTCWFHEEWLYRDEDIVCESTELDCFLSEV